MSECRRADCRCGDVFRLLRYRDMLGVSDGASLPCCCGCQFSMCGEEVGMVSRYVGCVNSVI